MTATVDRFHSLLETMGTPVTYHTEAGGVACPCLSPEGFRSPAWHKANPPSFVFMGDPLSAWWNGIDKFALAFLVGPGPDWGWQMSSVPVATFQEFLDYHGGLIVAEDVRRIYDKPDLQIYTLTQTGYAKWYGVDVAIYEAPQAANDAAISIEPAICNEKGRLASVVTEFIVQASVQPLRTMRRPEMERAIQLVGQVEQDDHIGVFPVEWKGHVLDFHSWDESGANFIIYNARRFFVVNSDKLPDVDGDPNHHWEVGMRVVRSDRIA